MEQYIKNLVGNLKNNCIQKCEYLFSAITQTEFSKTHFYKLVCMFSEKSDQPPHLHSLISLHHTFYKIYCFFVHIAQADQAAEMRRLIRVFTDQSCYFAEINVICFFSTCQKLWNSFSVVYCIFMKKQQQTNMFSSTFNNQSSFSKSRRALLWHIELLEKKED